MNEFLECIFKTESNLSKVNKAVEIESERDSVIISMFFDVMLLYLISMIVICHLCSYHFIFASFPFLLTSCFPPSSFRVVLVPQNQQNVCFPSKGWLNWHTASISQAILRQPSATACSCGDRSQTIPAFCCCFLLSTSSAAGLTGKTL